MRTTQPEENDQSLPRERFSELPEPMIHHIMSFLPTRDATRVSGLSRTFRSAFYSYPVVDVDQDFFYTSSSGLIPKQKVEEALDYMVATFRRRHEDFCVQKFRLRVCPNASIQIGQNQVGDVPIAQNQVGFLPLLPIEIDTPYSDDRIDEAIRYAVEHKVRELDLDVSGPRYPTRPCALPVAVLFAKHILVLRLKGLMLPTEDWTLQSPLIQEIHFKCCEGMKSFKLSCKMLKTLAIYSCFGLGLIEIDSPNLESFWYDYEQPRRHFWPCEIKNLASARESLKDLSLSRASISDEFIDCTVSTLLLLENLEMIRCRDLSYLRISNPNLKIMKLKYCGDLKLVHVSSPKLQSSFFAMPLGQISCAIDIAGCESLRDMTLERAQVTDEWLERTVSMLHSIKKVKLIGCAMLRNFGIYYHENLENFHIDSCEGVEEIKIYSKKLSLFVYCGKEVPHNIMIDSPAFDAEYSLKTDVLSTEIFERWIKLLTGFGNARRLTIVSKPEHLIVPEHVRKSMLSPLYDLKHLKVETTTTREMKLQHLLDGLLWFAPLPDTLAFSLDGSSARTCLKVLHFRYDFKMAKEKSFMHCHCYSKPIKCWRHHLKEVTIENFERQAEVVVRKFLAEEALQLEKILP